MAKTKEAPGSQAWAGGWGALSSPRVSLTKTGCPCRPPNQESGRWRSWPLVNLLMASAAAKCARKAKTVRRHMKICRAK